MHTGGASNTATKKKNAWTKATTKTGKNAQKKLCAKHNKQSPKILVTHMDVANTTSASEKAKY